MKIDIVAATALELEAIKKYHFAKHEVRMHTHGIGMMAAIFQLQKIAENEPDLIIQCGIAGTYLPEIKIGSTVLVAEEVTDIGAEDDQQLLDLFDLKFIEKNDAPYQNGVLPCPFLSTLSLNLPIVKGLTVNSASGSDSTIEKRIKKFGASIETMEGAALHYVGLMTQTPFLQIRTISNWVEKRHKENWNIPLALENNAAVVKNILDHIEP